MTAQGWYQDPFRRHEHRWFSEGRATSLVRDGEAESDDVLPTEEYDGPLVAAEAAELADGGDLLRADERADDRASRRSLVQAALDAATQSGWNFR